MLLNKENFKLEWLVEIILKQHKQLLLKQELFHKKILAELMQLCRVKILENVLANLFNIKMKMIRCHLNLKIKKLLMKFL